MTDRQDPIEPIERLDEHVAANQTDAERSDHVRRLRQAIQARDLLLEERERQLAAKTELVRGILASRSWRLTRPFRAATDLARKASAVRDRGGEERRLASLFDS